MAPNAGRTGAAADVAGLPGTDLGVGPACDRPQRLVSGAQRAQDRA